MKLKNNFAGQTTYKNAIKNNNMKKTNTSVTPAELAAIADRMEIAGQDIEQAVLRALIGSMYAGTTKELCKVIAPFVDAELDRIKSMHQ